MTVGVGWLVWELVSALLGGKDDVSDGDCGSWLVWELVSALLVGKDEVTWR